MGKQIHVANSALSNTIFAGNVLKDGRTWGANKQDVTGQACAAVAQHVLKFGQPVIVSSGGKPRYEIWVRDLQDNDEFRGGTPSAESDCWQSGGDK